MPPLSPRTCTSHPAPGHRWPRLSGVVAGCLLATLLVTATPAGAVAAPAAAPAPSPMAGQAQSAPGMRTVTLLTGDRVHVRPDGSLATVEPGEHRQRVPIAVREQAGHLLVVPDDAARLIAAGRLDQRLFDVTTLLEFGYDDARRDHLPLLVSGALPRPRRAALAGAGGSVTRELPSIDAVAVRATKPDATDLWSALSPGPGISASGVEAVWLDGLSQVTLDESVPQVGAPAAWQAGLTGSGTTVAILDTGIDTSHPDLTGRVVGAQDFLGEGVTSQDPNGHGTHVASTAAGTGAASSGQFRGVASGAQLLNGRVCNAAGLCPDSAIIAGMEWAAGQGADVVNLSVGKPDTEDVDPLEAAIDQLTAAHGTLFVVAAGNSGEQGPESLSSPGSAEAALTVGAVTKQDQLAEFSGRGPRIGDAALKPDLTAPGVDITAAFSSQAGGGPGQRYLSLSGTSMATPHVTGAAAILRQQHPGWPAGRIKAALMAAAQPAAGVGGYAQGAGRLDVARAITTTVTANPPSVSFGRPQWPHADDPAIPRTVSFRNDGTAPVTLSLSLAATDPFGSPAPAGMFTLGAGSLTVPAGGAAAVAVTAHPSVTGPDGHYTGQLTARIGSAPVATVPFGVDREVESYDLTLRHLDRTGALTSAYSTFLASVTTPRFWQRFDPDGELTIRVPFGSYALDSLVTTGSGAGVEFTMLVQPRVVVTQDTVVDVDARLAAPLDVTVPPAGAGLVGGFLGYLARRFPDGGFGTGWTLGGTLDGYYSAHLGSEVRPDDLVSHLAVTFAEPGPAGDFHNSPYAYHLGWAEEGRFPTGVSEHVTDAELAEFQTSYAAQTGDPTFGFQFAATDPLVNRLGWLTVSFGTSFDLPANRRELYTTETVNWNRNYAETTEPLDLFTTVTALADNRLDLVPGSVPDDRWNAGPFVPGMLGPNGPGRWASRTGDQIDVELPMFSDQSGHTGSSLTDTARTALFRNGSLVGETGTAGAGSFAVPAAAGEYRLEVEATRSVSDFATSVDAAWTFSSATTPSFPPSRLPLMSARFQPDLDDHNQAPAGTGFSFPLVIDRQSLGPAPTVTEVTVDVSYDDGASWQPATVSGSGNSYQVTVTHPAGTGFASLRAHATDADGNTLDQTVVRAYRLAGTTPPPASLAAQYQVGTTSPTTNQITNQLQLVNRGTAPVALPDVTVRYWYTTDGTQPQQYQCDWAQLGCATVVGGFTRLGAPRAGADSYLQLSFTGGTVAPGAATGPIQNRWHKTDWSNYQQTGDYSFDPSRTSFADWPRVTVYVQGQLVWGTEP